MRRALALTLVSFLSLASIGLSRQLTGTSDRGTTVMNFAQPINVAYYSSLTVNYILDGWTFTSYTIVDDGGWKDQTFPASRTLGVYALGSTIGFDPTAARPIDYFEQSTATGSASMAGTQSYGANWLAELPQRGGKLCWFACFWTRTGRFSRIRLVSFLREDVQVLEAIG